MLSLSDRRGSMLSFMLELFLMYRRLFLALGLTIYLLSVSFSRSLRYDCDSNGFIYCVSYCDFLF